MTNTRAAPAKQASLVPAGPFGHFIAGAIGGSIAAVILSPLDILRTRMQSSDPSVRQLGGSPHRILAQITRTEGVRALYRGLIPTVLGAGPSRALYFGGFNFFKLSLERDLGIKGTPLHLTAAASSGLLTNTLMSPWWVIRLRLQLQKTPVEPVLAPLQRAWAAMLARRSGLGPAPPGAPGVPLPAGVLGAGGAADAPHPKDVGYKGVIDAARRIYREEGWRTFYRGLSASYLGVVETAVQFAIYGAMKEAAMEALSARQARLDAAAEALRVPARAASSSSSSSSNSNSISGGVAAPALSAGSSAGRQLGTEGAAFAAAAPAAGAGAASGGSASHSKSHPPMRITPQLAFGLSAVSKLIASALTYPHEVLRTRMREQHASAVRYKTLLQSARLIVQEEGVRALYGGMTVHLLRTVPNAAILLVVVEKLVGGAV